LSNHSFIHSFNLIARGSSRWIGLLAYGDFVSSQLRDHHRAEDILWEAAKLSVSASIWASIALAHFYQYCRGNYKAARRVIIWARRRRIHSNTTHKPVRTKAHVNKLESAKDKESLRQDQDESAVLLIVFAHICLETGNLDAARGAATAALEIDPHCTTFLRQI
jgi:uncharacterized membrane-anchored protein